MVTHTKVKCERHTTQNMGEANVKSRIRDPYVRFCERSGPSGPTYSIERIDQKMPGRSCLFVSLFIAFGIRWSRITRRGV